MIPRQTRTIVRLAKTLFKSLRNYSETVSLTLNLFRSKHAADRELTTTECVAVTDQINKMPKFSTYFYDWIHFTNQGAQQMAEIIWDDFRAMLVDVGSG